MRLDDIRPEYKEVLALYTLLRTLGVERSDVNVARLSTTREIGATVTSCRSRFWAAIGPDQATFEVEWPDVLEIWSAASDKECAKMCLSAHVWQTAELVRAMLAHDGFRKADA
jgi:hypothetical protein